jgi:hypothetical protein
MVNFHENRNEQILDSFSSDVYCAKFKSSDFENQFLLDVKINSCLDTICD